MRPEAPGKADTFEVLMAALSFELGMTLQDDITLSRYNEYLKLIEKKQRAMKQAKERGQYGRT